MYCSIWSALKTASNTLGSRFDLETSQSGQHLLNVLHIDIHSVVRIWGLFWGGRFFIVLFFSCLLGSVVSLFRRLESPT